jgi:hypothetical protein
VNDVEYWLVHATYGVKLDKKVIIVRTGKEELWIIMALVEKD